MAKARSRRSRGACCSFSPVSASAGMKPPPAKSAALRFPPPYMVRDSSAPSLALARSLAVLLPRTSIDLRTKGALARASSLFSLLSSEKWRAKWPTHDQGKLTSHIGKSNQFSQSQPKGEEGGQVSRNEEGAKGAPWEGEGGARTMTISSMYVRVKREKTTYFIQAESSDTILELKEKLQELIDQV